MSKYKDIVYMCLDELKMFSDDADITEEHIIFLANKYRVFLLKQRYSDVRKNIPESNYQTLCLDLEKADKIEGLSCEGGSVLKTKVKLPSILPIGETSVYTGSYYGGEITFVSKERMRYVGYNKWMKNIIYASQDTDGKLCLYANNPQFMYLENIKVHALFEDTEEADKYKCCDEGDASCDILDSNFPLEDALIIPMIGLIVKELTPVSVTPEDKENDADDGKAPKSEKEKE